MNVRFRSALAALALAGAALCSGCSDEYYYMVPKCVEGNLLYLDAFDGSTGSTDSPRPYPVIVALGSNSDFLHAELVKLDKREDGRFDVELRLTGEKRNGEIVKGRVSACHF